MEIFLLARELALKEIDSKPCVVVHTCDTIAWEVETRAAVQVHPRLHNDLETILSYM